MRSGSEESSQSLGSRSTSAPLKPFCPPERGSMYYSPQRTRSPRRSPRPSRSGARGCRRWAVPSSTMARTRIYSPSVSGQSRCEAPSRPGTSRCRCSRRRREMMLGSSPWRAILEKTQQERQDSPSSHEQSQHLLGSLHRRFREIFSGGLYVFSGTTTRCCRRNNTTMAP